MFTTLAVMAITLLAVISPGADFAMVTRNSLLHGRAAGLMAALGIAFGVQLHVLYTMLGVGVLIQSSPQCFFAIKAAGALYLIYVGYRTFTSLPVAGAALRGHPALSPWAALRAGFLTNALNPKTTLFVVSIYTQVVQAGTPVAEQVGYGLFMSAAHWVWFSLVAVFFSDVRLRTALLRRQVALNRGIGSVLVALGCSLALSSASLR